MYETKCCKKILCYNCFLHNNKENFLKRCPFCYMLTKKGKLFDIIKLKTLCKECKTKEGKYSYSSICPHVFCKECFKKKKKESDHCPYCNQPLIRRQDNQCTCCFEAITNKTDTYKHCNSIFCKSCILSSLKIKGNTDCLYCSKDIITTARRLCKSVIPEDHGKVYLTSCCKNRLCFTCFKEHGNRMNICFMKPANSWRNICPCCHFNHQYGPRYRIIMLKKNCKKCNTNIGKCSISFLCPNLYCEDCIKTINRKNHTCVH
ncbi:uncharacterized protein LOC126898726 [Daktulosphaira vitifoliae]|uniref:uncharacterized protein LOC126898726 n=1 Tax=Daktulosphaira vitifoliae TaxID=58002 RepID=UPI0021A9B046|nr:uncharacterized protein LOC126898726 [Daktulosphaira vitifoliae]XP_050528988.1 uncharacterized protein LOC126898726 [Daktulosphaira vitifoliae]